MQFKKPIDWYVTGSAGQTNLGQTGPHEVFVTWGQPKEHNSRNMSNYLTYKRIKLATGGKVAGGQSNVDKIARKVHQYVNGNASQLLYEDPSVTRPHTKGRAKEIDGTKKDGGQYWGLLDSPGYSGQCGEASYLMEMMNRLLGVNAMQVHVHAAETVQDIEKFLVYKGHGDKKDKTEMHKARKCKVHAPNGWEYLSFTFGYGLKDFQYGEGCCRVNRKLYAGFVDLVGRPTRGRTAAHHMLLQLESYYMRRQRKYDSKKPNFRPHFQLWIYEKPGKTMGVCGLAKPPGPNPFPRVPR
jgi:hypothetical protein